MVQVGFEFTPLFVKQEIILHQKPRALTTWPSYLTLYVMKNLIQIMQSPNAKTNPSICHHQLYCKNFWEKNLKIVISVSKHNTSRYLKIPRQAYTRVLSSHQNRKVEMLCFKKDIKDSKSIYCIKSEKNGFSPQKW